MPINSPLGGIVDDSIPGDPNVDGRVLAWDDTLGRTVWFALTLSAFTGASVGQIPFGITGGALGQDSNLFWDDTNNRLGIGTSSPTARMAIHAATASQIATIIRSTDDSSTNVLTSWQGSGGGQLAYVDASGNIGAIRIYSNIFRDANSGNTWFSLTGTAPNQTMAIGNTGVSSVLFTSKSGSGTFAFNNATIIGGTTPNAAALLQLDSTAKGFLPPRMTTTQKNAISTPPSGLIVYDTTLGKLCVYGATTWETITSV